MLARMFGADPARVVLLLRAAWPRAVGPELARRTEVVALDRGVLRVRVPDAAWLKVLHRMEDEILARLRALAAEVAPRRLGFVLGEVAGSERGSEAPPAPVASASMLGTQLAADIERIPDTEIRDRFAASASRYLERQRRRPGRGFDDVPTDGQTGAASGKET